MVEFHRKRTGRELSMTLLFKNLKKIEAEIENYLDMVVKAGFLFKQGIKYYLEGYRNDFKERLTSIDELEHNADILRRSIESKLYEKTLIPESRGDVLSLLEGIDRVLDRTAETLHMFSVESPLILPEIKPLSLELAEASMSALEMMINGIRAYFREIKSVRDFINKVQIYETESDKIFEKLIRTVFETEIHLSEKIHLRYFAYQIERIANEAEDVGDRLAIATIKRHL
jgi:predicted phosphate transport protein (TIGR00153 family)